jgi:crotonyl-CoA carboxylase/reductase
MSRDTVEQIIGRFGSQQRVAELLGIWQTAVSGWVRRGAIPARRQAQLLSIAQREGIALSPADFFGLPRGEGAESIPAQAGPNGAQIIPLNGAARQPAIAQPLAAGKDLYEIGEIPPLGHVPKNMYAWVIRRERHGEPSVAMQQEVVPTPSLDSDEVLVMVMAAGVNYNGVWAALGASPTSRSGSSSIRNRRRWRRQSSRPRSRTWPTRSGRACSASRSTARSSTRRRQC